MTRIDFPFSLPARAISIDLQSLKNTSVFRSNEILEGEILGQVDLHHTLIRIKGYEFLAEGHLSFPKGAKILLRVAATSPQVILNPVSGEEKHALFIDLLLKRYLPAHFSSGSSPVSLSKLNELMSGSLPPQLRDTLEKLSALLSHFSTEGIVNADPNYLREIVTRSGLFFENKMKQLTEGQRNDPPEKIVREDLKGLLITLKDQLTSVDQPGNDRREVSVSPQKISGGLEQVLDKIEGTQVLNLLSSEERQNIFLLLPLWLPNDLYFSEVNISLPNARGEGTDAEGVSILFLLQMPEWGRMSLELKVREKELYGTFSVSDGEVASFLEENFPALCERLTNMGFHPRLNIAVEDPEKIPHSLFPGAGVSDSLLNIVI
jgi:hypothetical protein